MKAPPPRASKGAGAFDLAVTVGAVGSLRSPPPKSRSIQECEEDPHFVEVFFVWR